MSKYYQHLIRIVTAASLTAIPVTAHSQRWITASASPDESAEVGGATDNTSASPSVNHNACQFCHRPEEEMLRNRSYTMYEGLSVDMRMDAQPTLNSLICISCHDGSVQDGPLANPANEHLIMGHDLRNDHPISIIYESNRDGEFFPATPGPTGDMQVGGLPLFDSRVECATCHEPHSGEAGALRISNDRSALCLTCHDK